MADPKDVAVDKTPVPLYDDFESTNMNDLYESVPPISQDVKRSTPVVFKGLTYTVDSNSKNGKKVQLLKNLTGCFSPGQMSALMGPSGSGKTTLLDVLAGRKTQGEITGDILFSARKPSVNFLRRFTGYVEQFDTLLDILTVREMLLYTAEMKRPVSEPLAEKERVVDHFIDVLGLGVCKDTRIGGALSRGISGGQAKRCNIAIAMVVNPKVLFLDEPTSGLDSYTSNETMSVVRELLSSGVTICATIHSPSPATFALFDRLLVLVRGECVYHGPNGSKMVEYLRTGCGVPPPPSSVKGTITNDADFLTDLVVASDRANKYTEYAQAYQKSDLRKAMDEIVDDNTKRDTMNLSKEENADLNVKRATATPLWWALITLIKYRTTRNYSTPDYLGPRLGDKIVFSLIIATLYLGIGDDFTSENVLNVAAVLFMWCTMPAFGAAAYVPALSLEKPLYLRERNDGLYRPITYLLAKLVDELLITTIVSVIFSVFVFYVVQFQGNFLLFWLVYLVTLCNGILLAYFIASLSPNMDVANASLPMYVVTLLFFAGFLLRFDDTPEYWKWYTYINMLRYAWSALMIDQFEGKIDPTTNEPVLVGGQPILEYYGLDSFSSKWEALGYECLFLFAFFGLAWATLQFKKHSKR